jgi:hypothetical protein
LKEEGAVVVVVVDGVDPKLNADVVVAAGAAVDPKLNCEVAGVAAGAAVVPNMLPVAPKVGTVVVGDPKKLVPVVGVPNVVAAAAG